MMVLPKDVHNFVKDKVFTDWIDVAGRVRGAETELEVLDGKLERITKKLNDSLAALKLGSVEELTEHKATELNEDSSDNEKE